MAHITVDQSHFVNKKAVERTVLGNTLEDAERRVETQRQMEAWGVEIDPKDVKASKDAVDVARKAIVDWHAANDEKAPAK